MFLRPRIGPRNNFVDAGWIGGDAKLTADFDYPIRDGVPYQFLLEVDCSRLPTETWGGYMPHVGWVAVFVATSGNLDVRLIYSLEAAVEHRKAGSWRPENSSLYASAERYERFLKPPVAWPLAKAAGIGALVSPTRQRPKDEPFTIADSANWPLDWETHILLIEEAIRNLDNRARGYEDAARQRLATFQSPPPRLLALLEEFKATALNLSEYFRHVSQRQKFTHELWRGRRNDHIRCRLLTDEWSIESNHGLHRALGLVRIEKANNLGQWPSKIVPSPLFSSSSHPGRVHARILKEAQNLEAELNAAPDLPKQDAERMGPDYTAWADYRTQRPSEWLRFKERILEVRAEFYGYWLDNQEAVNEALGGWDLFPLPASWEEAIDGASQTASWAETALSKVASVGNEQDQAFVRERMDIAHRAANAAEILRAELAKANRWAASTGYVAGDKIELFKIIDAFRKDELLDEFWHLNFELIRSEVGKRIYVRDPDLLSPLVKDRLERRWQFDAEQATIELGGRSEGYRRSFINKRDQTIMLFRIPSNHLTALSFGDVNDLVISISEKDLRARRFDLIDFDITN